MGEGLRAPNLMGFPWDPGGGLHPQPKGEVKPSPYGEFVTIAEPSPNPSGDPSQASSEVRTGNAMRASSGQVRTLLPSDRRSPDTITEEGTARL